MIMSNQMIIKKIKVELLKISQELQLHGGGVTLFDFKDGVAYVNFQGACLACSSACGLMSNFEQKLQEAVPEIKKIIVL